MAYNNKIQCYEYIKNRMDRTWKYGEPMVQNLLKAGYSVTVFNRSKDKEVPLIALELPQPQVRKN
jgi:hypothetical protein